VFRDHGQGRRPDPRARQPPQTSTSKFQRALAGEIRFGAERSRPETQLAQASYCSHDRTTRSYLLFQVRGRRARVWFIRRGPREGQRSLYANRPRRRPRPTYLRLWSSGRTPTNGSGGVSRGGGGCPGEFGREPNMTAPPSLAFSTRRGTGDSRARGSALRTRRGEDASPSRSRCERAPRKPAEGLTWGPEADRPMWAMDGRRPR
jgi:hypothetical protein